MRMSLIALSVPAICLAQAQPQPRMTLDSTHHDFGKIAPNTVVSHRFKVTNTGDALLTITRLNPSCGCTSSVVGKDQLAPGESTELEVTFNSAGYSGPIKKSVEVVSNDPVQLAQTLIFSGDVAPNVKVSTQELRFLDLRRGDRRRASVQLESGTGRPMELSDVQLSKAPWLGVTTREMGMAIWVDFDLLAKRLPPGQLTGTDTVTVQVRNPMPSAIVLKVRWEQVEPVIATPRRVAWAEAAGKPLSMAIQLKSRDHKAFRILSARTTNPLVQISGVSPKAAASQAVLVLLSPTAQPGAYDEKAYLTLDTPGHPELEIRVAASLH
jgi:hypothetical protein